MQVKSTGTIDRNGYGVEKLILETEPGILLPALLFKPAKENGKRTLYLHGGGKQVDALAGGPIEKLVQAGQIVLAVDLRGIGETGPAEAGAWGGNWYDFFTSYLLGKSMVGMRAEDILQSARFLSTAATKGPPGKVDLIAIGVTGPPALHAAALESHLFDNIKLVRSLSSWSDVVRNPDTAGQLINTVHGALKAYDLPDLLSVIPAEKVTIEEPLNLNDARSAKVK